VPSHADQLKQIVAATPWLMALLRAVRDVGPREAYIAAGAIRDLVWNSLTERQAPGLGADVDVVYFDASEAVERSRQHEQALRLCITAVRWEVTNQAWVHLWQAKAGGGRHSPHASLAAGLATWPETATAVGVRLDTAEQLSLIAPFGLEDLFSLVVRHNPARASAAVYWERVTKKAWAQRWPELKILRPHAGEGSCFPP
jgi:hypothetical protein